MLRLENATLNIDGVSILDAIDLHVGPQESLGLIGPNGSGKSSLLNVITGIYPVTQGRVLVDGFDVTGLDPHEIVARGVARTAQTTRLFERLSVIDNIRAVKGGNRQAAEALLEQVELIDHRYMLAGALSFAQRRRLDLGRALMLQPSLLLLDEPAAALTDSETEAMADLIATVAAPGRALIVIEHKIRLVAALCPRVAVLNVGRKVAEGTPAQIVENELVQSIYFGAEEHTHAPSS